MVKRLLMLLSAVVGVILLATGTAAAGPVTVHDDSKVLDVTKVTNAAMQLTDPVQIFTTQKFSDDRGKFDQETQAHVSGSSDVVLAINTKSGFFTIRTGTNSHIKDTSAAGSAFQNGLGSNHDYTSATIAALGSLKSATGQGAPTGAKAGNPAPAPVAKPAAKSSGFGWLGLLCPIVIIGGIIAAVVAFLRRRRNPPPPPPMGGGGFGGGYPGGPGYGGPGFGAPGYGPPPGRPGMSPGAAAGLGAVGGAVGGGLLGYELGRMEGEHEERGRDNYAPPQEYGGGGYDPGNQQWGGGGGDYDFGGGGDSGGGGGDFGGGGGDFGGGGGDFGGGDSGGGGGGDF
ncbi:hypothetical protein ACFXHA_06190 [Nocardia sp. NPDC059240]|uniref:hypothetical protein n=1 Tax=Nocardia sp. NPDC059240 TaxID=3346786 RepID=UPI00368246E8